MAVDSQTPDDATAPHRRRWPFVVVGLVVVLLATATVWLWNRAAAPEGISVSIAPTDYNLGEHTRMPLELTVTNRSGATLTDARLRVSLAEPGDDLPPATFHKDMYDPECGVEDPGTPPECVEAEKRAKRQDCAAHDATVACDGDIPEGTDAYAFTYRIGDLPDHDELAALVDYPDLKVRAEVRVDGTTIAEATRHIRVRLPEGYGRVDVADIPTDMALTDPASRHHDWTLTVTNDTDTDVTDATVSIQLNSGHRFAEVDSAHEGCSTDPDAGADSEVECAHVDIPAGATITIAARMNIAAGAAGRFDEYCPPGSPTVDRCRSDAAELTLLVKATAADYHGYTNAKVDLRYRD